MRFEEVMQTSNFNVPKFSVESRPFQIVTAIIARAGGCGLRSSFCALCISGAAVGAPVGDELPTGAVVSGGSASISTNGNRMDVTQTTQKTAIDWKTFNIGSAAHVHFNQPSGGVLLNRVLDTNASQIYGRLSSVGQVFLVNPNGVLFSPSAQVDVNGIVASTLNITNSDYMTGKYTFGGGGSGTIVNRGKITTSPGGIIALIAAKITNHGTLNAEGGSVLLGAGSKVTLDLGGPVKIQVEQGVVDVLIEQGGLIKADGGLVYLNAKSVGDISATVINHTGVTEANTLTTGKRGEIYLLGDMVHGRINVGGKLDASAPNAGDGGFIETSAARVQIAADTSVMTRATRGRTGEWLIDPVDITIASNGNITGNAIATALQNTNVTLDTSGSGSCTGSACIGLAGTSGDIIVNDNINVIGGSADTTLTLKANRNITVNANKSISRTGSYKLNTVLWADSDATGGGAIWLKASAGTGATISTNGGNMTFSGGSNLITGYAEGTNTMGNGILLDTATLMTDGGNIVIRGRGFSNVSNNYSTSDAIINNTDGVRMAGSNSINSGIGTIDIQGVAQGLSGGSNGIETNSTGYTKILSSATNTTAINFNGNATEGAGTFGWGTFLWGKNTSGIVLAATGVNGGITLSGNGRNVANGGGIHLEPHAYVLASSGPISISGTKGAVSNYEGVVINGTMGYITSLPSGFGYAGNMSPVSSSVSDITFAADTMSVNRVFGGGSFSDSAVQSSGSLSIKPYTEGNALSVQFAAPASGAWIKPNSMFGTSGLFKTGFNKLVFGSPTTGTVKLDNFSFDNDTNVISGDNAVLGGVVIATKTLTVDVTGNGTITDSGAINVSKLKLNGVASAATLDSTANTIGTIAANVSSLSLLNNGALNIGTVGGTDGITATGSINIATKAGDLTIAQSISTGDTTPTAIVLNSGKDSTATTATGGNILYNSGTITTGNGGRATFYTGTIASSAGLTTMIGSGSGRFRYASDETITNFTAALSSGLYTVYRESPSITVQPANYTSAVGATPAPTVFALSSGSLSNGDTLSGTINASIYSSGTSASASGKYNLTIIGLPARNTLGYLLAGVDNTGGHTISPATNLSTTNTIVQTTEIASVQKTVSQLPVVNAPCVDASNLFDSRRELTIAQMEGVLSSITTGAQSGNDFRINLGKRHAFDCKKVFIVGGGLNFPAERDYSIGN